MADRPTYQELEQRIRELEQIVDGKSESDAIHNASESSFSQLFESAPVAMGYAIDREGYLGTTWNAAWYDTFGYSYEEANGRSGNEIGLWVDPCQRDCLIDSAKQQNYVADFDALLKRKDGTVLHCSLFGDSFKSQTTNY